MEFFHGSISPKQNFNIYERNAPRSTDINALTLWTTKEHMMKINERLSKNSDNKQTWDHTYRDDDDDDAGRTNPPRTVGPRQDAELVGNGNRTSLGEKKFNSITNKR